MGPHTVRSGTGPRLGPDEPMRHTHRRITVNTFPKKSRQSQPSAIHWQSKRPMLRSKTPLSKPKPCRATQGEAAVPKHTNAVGSAHFLPTASAAAAVPAGPAPRRPRVPQSGQGGEGQRRRRAGGRAELRAEAPGEG